MPPKSEAEEHLRVIRSLMEKATVYRAVSAPGALAGGLLAVVTSLAGIYFSNPDIPAEDEIWWFFAPWVVVFAITGIVNLWLLGRDAAQGGGFHFSERMRTALRCMLPGFLAGGICSFLQSDIDWATIASLWVMLYGVSLLGMGLFAPKSLLVLGWVFFVSGAAILIAGLTLVPSLEVNPLTIAHGIMGATFGLFHLVYALCSWPRRSNV